METKTTHTPGPWTYQGSMNAKEILIGRQQEFTYMGKSSPMPIQYGQEIATVQMDESIEHRGGIDPRAEADARLIAAAPELLVALKMMAAKYNIPGLYDSAAQKAAYAAIAKAEGQEGK